MENRTKKCYALGYFWKKANTTGAIASFFTGLMSWIFFYLYFIPATMEANMDVLVDGQVYMPWAVDDAIFISLVPAAFISLLTLVVVSLATQHRDPAKPMLSKAGEDMDKMPRYFWSKN